MSASPWTPVGPPAHMFCPKCVAYGATTAIICLYRDADDWRLTYNGAGGLNAGGEKVNLWVYGTPDDLQAAIDKIGEGYNDTPHEALKNVSPNDVYTGRKD